jgi:acyl-CoA reductase-like NAD-dependent aldehyde dehydrogenase
MMNHIISGIFAGNAVVGKVSEHTSWSAQYFTRIVQTALAENGHNPDLVQTITGFGDAGAALVSDPLVDKIIFTGSPAIGKKVMEAASHHLKPVILELGGKDAMVIMDDCKLESVLPWVMRGCFQNGGQNCIGIERILVYEALYDDFLKLVQPMVQALRQGIPLKTCEGNDANIDCGSMVMDAQLELIQALVDDAVKNGAKVLCGGKRNGSFSGPGQQFYEPTIVAGVTPDMRIYQEELFGPVMTVVKVPQNDDAICLEMINQSNFGLGSSVYCGNQARGLTLGRRIRSGMCCINDFGSNYLVQSLPFGGVKDSGFGRFAGPEGLQALCLERAILTDRIPGVKTTIPSSLTYPIDNMKGLAFADSLIQLFYNESWIGKIRGIFGLIKYG